jgi:trigger factor
MEQSARRSVKAGFVLDQLARQEELGIEQDELNSFVIEQAYRMGVQPDRLAQELTDRGQIGSVITEVLRGKALTLITERATVTDEAGQPVDVSAALQPDETAETSEAGDAEAGPAGSAGAEDSLAEDSLAEASAPEASAPEASAAEASAPKKPRARKPRAPKAKAAASAGDAEEGSADDEPGGSTA